MWRTPRPRASAMSRVVESRRCCTNRLWPARCPPTGSSPADAIRHWSAEGGHPIEDRTAEDGLTPLPSWTPGAKAIADDGLVAKERVLHPALTMVPGRLLPLAPAELLHQRDRSIPRGRPRAVPRDGRRPGRWDDDRRTPRPRRVVDGDRVRGGVSGDAHERTSTAVSRSRTVVASSPVRLEFVVRPPLGAGSRPGSGRPNGTLFSSARATM